MKALQMRKNLTRGYLFTFCGLDGCGKTTMIQRLEAWLKQQGKPVLLTRQPTDAVRNSAIFRTYMDQPDHRRYDYRSLSMLAAADRIQHVNKEIYPAMQEGKIVLSDRYFYSCLANLLGRGYERDRWIYEAASFVLQPDAAFFLDISVEEAIARVRQRAEEKERYIHESLQYRLRDFYIEIARKNKGILLSTAEDEEKTFETIKKTVQKCLEENRNGYKKRRL